ncbi:MAG: hypothetical protein UW24_C0014G0004 [Parcubacteria group bacterium GW2011_GWA2_44_12]|nr:MAG: hypothetical protein UW24_C0014G0004 [Parcubacteria group bacterium GW2011_GWA2_44_12]
MKKVAVIVLTWNARRYAEDLFLSVRKLAYPKEYRSIFVVDNASEDGSAEYIKNYFSEITLIQLDQNIGFAGGNNVGMMHALAENFEYIVLLNHDTEVDSQWLCELVKAAESSKDIGAVQSLVLLQSEREIINTRGNEFFYLGIGYSGGYKEQKNEYLLKLAESKKAYPQCAYASGSSLLLKASVLREVGLFNEEHFAYPEDFDLGWRIRLAGYTIVTAPRSIMFHKYEFNRHKVRQYYWLERNRILILYANYRFATLLLLLPMLILLECALWGFFILEGGARWKLKSYGYILRHLSRAIREKKVVAKLRRVSDRRILEFFSGTLKFADMNNAGLRVLNLAWGAYFHFVKFVVRW